jgi:hypothetical protein
MIPAEKQMVMLGGGRIIVAMFMLQTLFMSNK